jgi:integrase
VGRGKRRGHGEGSVFFHDGRQRWVAVIDIDAYLGLPCTGRRRRKTLYAKTRNEVLTKKRAFERQLDAGLSPAPERMTMADLFDRFLADGLDPSLAETTVDNYRWAIESHLRPALGSLRVSAVTAVDVERLLRAAHDQGLALNTRKRIRHCLGTVLDFAGRNGWVARNVVEFTRNPRGDAPERDVISRDAIARLLPVLADERLGALYLLCLTIGVRQEEARGLRWQDVDLDTGTVHITVAMKHRRGGDAFGPTKTRRSVRSVAVPSQVIDALHRHRIQQDRERDDARATWRDHDLVFATQVGTPLDPSNIRRDWRRVCERAGIAYVTPRNLRRSAATALSELGVPLEQIADVLGHKGTRMTGEVYRQVGAAPVDAAKTPMERLLSEADG